MSRLAPLLVAASAGWALAFGDRSAIAAAIAFAMAFGPLAVLVEALPAAAYAVAAGGAWLALSPLVLGYAWPPDALLGVLLVTTSWRPRI